MKVLVVDDERIFNLPNDNITYARTSDEAIDHLTQFEYDAIFLDHDLGGDDTTIRVAQFLKEYEETTPVFIHSQNPVGRKNLKFDLPHAKFANLSNLL